MVDSTNLPAIDINAIATDLNNKADRDLVNSTVPYVVSRTPNEQGGIVEIWSDGYCVQTGIGNESTSGGRADFNITLTQSYRDTNYIGFMSAENSGGTGWGSIGFVALTTTTCKFTEWIAGTGKFTNIKYRIEGYIR